MFYLGSCRCGSELKCTINNKIFEQAHISCEMSKGEKIKQCSKRYLRKPFREEIAKQMQGKSVEVYRSE